MNATPHDGTTQRDDRDDEPDRRRGEQLDEDREVDREACLSRVDASQLAAPSTRRWRRAGRFDSAS